MCAPSAANKRACPAPIPRPAPVTIASFSVEQPHRGESRRRCGKGSTVRRERDHLTGKDEVRVARAQRGSVGLDDRPPIRGDAARMCLPCPASSVAAMLHRLSPATTTWLRVTGGADCRRHRRRDGDWYGRGRRGRGRGGGCRRPVRARTGSSTATTGGWDAAPAGVCARAGETTSDAPQATPAARRTSRGRERGAPAQAAASRRYSRAAVHSARPSAYQAVTRGGDQPRRREDEGLAVARHRRRERRPGGGEGDDRDGDGGEQREEADPGHDAAPYEIV